VEDGETMSIRPKNYVVKERRRNYSQGFYMLTKVAEAFKLTGNEFLVFTRIARDLFVFKRCTVTNVGLQNSCGLSAVTVKKCIHRLRNELELITSRKYSKVVKSDFGNRDGATKNYRTRRYIRINYKKVWAAIKPKTKRKKVIFDSNLPIWIQFPDLAVKLLKYHVQNDRWHVYDSMYMDLKTLKLDAPKLQQLDKEMRALLANEKLMKMAMGES
jgi:hypothetical protein